MIRDGADVSGEQDPPPAKGLLEDDQEIWFDDGDVNDQASIFYAEFPTLPDFPCMSSSSSSSSTPAPVKATTCSASSSSSSASSAASWAVLKSDNEEVDAEKKAQSTEANNTIDTPSMEVLTDGNMNPLDCMDMMETFGYMDLLETDELLDPSSIFHDDFDQEQLLSDQPPVPEAAAAMDPMIDLGNDVVLGSGSSEESDMASVFLEWLRTNKETVSAEDLRSVKIKKSVIESAARHLGGGKEAMKQLLKLVLEWVQTNHLQRRRSGSGEASPFPPPPDNGDIPFQTPNPNPSYESTPAMYQPSPMAAGYVGDPSGQYPFVNGSHPIYPPAEHYNNFIDTAQTWPSSQFSIPSPYVQFPDPMVMQPAPQGFGTFGAGQYNPYNAAPYYHEPSSIGTDQRLARLGSSATKEARKKRMARQRRLMSHHRHSHHHHHHPHNNGHQNQQIMHHQSQQVMDQQHAMRSLATVDNAMNWPVYWPAGAVVPPAQPPPAMMPLEPPPQPAPVPSPARAPMPDKRQGWKPEKNLRFLLQKVLKQSDVGSLGRIVLPKKEAENHLPELEARDGISIPMEDIGTSRVWNMRYRYWPNNKSRMYLLENTGDFVRANGLQEGDFIVIYSDMKCGKYMIRGVKVRQQGAKSENKRPVKTQKTANNVASSSSQKKQ